MAHMSAPATSAVPTPSRRFKEGRRELRTAHRPVQYQDRDHLAAADVEGLQNARSQLQPMHVGGVGHVLDADDVQPQKFRQDDAEVVAGVDDALFFLRQLWLLTGRLGVASTALGRAAQLDVGSSLDALVHVDGLASKGRGCKESLSHMAAEALTLAHRGPT